MKDKMITLHVETGRGVVDVDFDHTEKVAEAAKKAALKKDYPENDNYVFVFNGEQLQAQRTLESYHLKDLDTVTLSAQGDSY